MKIFLDGYFDNNFGDDYMMKIIVHKLSDYEFVIKAQQNISQLITQEKNVSIITDIYDDKDINIPKLIITGSGFMINSVAALKCELKWFIKGQYIGDYCAGCNIEPFDNKIKEYLIKKKLQKFKMIICRDKYTYNWLSKKCKKTKNYYLPDIMFSMPDEWIEKSDIKPTKLGIAVLHRNNDSIDCDYYKQMAKAADYWIEKTGETVYLLSFNAGNENDVYACECIKKIMNFSKKAKIIKHGTNGEIIKAYVECKKIIGARFHSAVLAIKMGIDFFPVIYRNKMKNLIDDINYNVKGSYIDDINFKDIQSFLNCDKIKYHLPERIVSDAKRYSDIIRENISKGCDIK